MELSRKNTKLRTSWLIISNIHPKSPELVHSMNLNFRSEEEPDETSVPLLQLKRRKRIDEGRNVAAYQRGTKFVHLDNYYKGKKIENNDFTHQGTEIEANASVSFGMKLKIFNGVSIGMKNLPPNC